MRFGPGLEQWDRLSNALDRLADATGARFAVVMDESNDLWCWSRGLSRDDEAPFLLLERALATTDTALRRGGRIDAVKLSPDFAARSFAAIYLVILSFDRLGDPFRVRGAIAEALPEIETLTLDLPPPAGPDAMSGVAAVRRKR
jgi:hypothetical protein